MLYIINSFQLENNIGLIRPVNVGFINESYLLKPLKEGDKSYFLQKINHQIFRDVEGLQKNILLVTNQLRAKLLKADNEELDRKVLKLIPTQDGKLYYKDRQGSYWRIYEYIH